MVLERQRARRFTSKRELPQLEEDLDVQVVELVELVGVSASAEVEGPPNGSARTSSTRSC